MPVARYFLFVGGALLALLFAIDAYVPQQAALAMRGAPSIDKTMVRIRSDQKPLERVVYDTSLPTIVPPAGKVQVAAAVPAAQVPDMSAKARVRETFAQFVPAEARKLEQPQGQAQIQRKRKIAKTRPAQPMRLAQQSHFGFFGNSTW
jgi:hypothetical protein